MKKSRAIRLVLLGGASLMVTSCGEDNLPQDAKFFTDVQECSAAFPTADCQAAQAESVQAHAADAPRFTQKQECEAEFGPGNCETHASQSSGGGSFFMPMMMGYMLGNMMNNNANRFAQPVYRGPNNTAVMPNNGRLFNVGNFGGSGVGRSAGFRPSQVAEVPRGGFGGTANSFRSTAGS